MRWEYVKAEVSFWKVSLPYHTLIPIPLLSPPTWSGNEPITVPRSVVSTPNSNLLMQSVCMVCECDCLVALSARPRAATDSWWHSCTASSWVRSPPPRPAPRWWNTSSRNSLFLSSPQEHLYWRCACVCLYVCVYARLYVCVCACLHVFCLFVCYHVNIMLFVKWMCDQSHSVD